MGSQVAVEEEVLLAQEGCDESECAFVAHASSGSRLESPPLVLCKVLLEAILHQNCRVHSPHGLGTAQRVGLEGFVKHFLPG